MVPKVMMCAPLSPISGRPTAAAPSAESGLHAYWAVPAVDLLSRLGTSLNGLSSQEAERRLRENGPNQLREHPSLSRLVVLARQLRSPLLFLLVFAAATSAFSGEWIDSMIVVFIVIATAGIGYSREYRAQTAAAALRARIRMRAQVWRDGELRSVPVEQIVPGDVVALSAGTLVPADGVILEATNCFVSEAVLTGESFPAEKTPTPVPEAAGLAARRNCVYLGTNVRSGTARAVIVKTGPATEFGAIALRLTLRSPETEFDRALRRFGYLLSTAMLIMVLLVFVAHALMGRPPVETLLFSVALAVGLSPELLPAILSVSLARGAQLMARQGVLVRHLNAIENLGSVDILCTDKTGTLTEGVIQVEGAYDAAGASSSEVLEVAAYNAALETGVTSPLDEAILRARQPPLGEVRKLAEIPFDFIHRRVTVVVRDARGVQLLIKGAFHQVLEICTRLADGTPLAPQQVAALGQQYAGWSRQGLRVLGVAAKEVDEKDSYGRGDEHGLTFLGFVTFLDRPKNDVSAALTGLVKLGVSVKVITGDNLLVTQHIASLVGMRAERVLTGRELDELNDEALWHAAEKTDLFVEVDPNQKERIILSLKKMGHVVAFLGDGVNDAPAMHAADTSLSVEQAVDVAREAADFVLLERSLDVIRCGIQEGRRIFANTLKYVLITTSANLGNMMSMAAVSLVLPFLPLTAGQILLNNFLSDVPAVGLADDAVDPELVDRPRRWDMRFIARYMVEFGLLSSVFDFLTFWMLLVVFRADVATFRTSWFVESLLTELVIALVVRTQRPFFRSRPGTVLLLSTAAVVVVALTLPYFPFARLFGFVPLPAGLVLAITGIAALYVVATEVLKIVFYRSKGIRS
jgi:Mg2+-importing ATPase